MFPTEPPPYFIVETQNTVRRSSARQRTMSQLTLVSVRIPQSHADENGPVEHDDCDEWQLVHKRVSARKEGGCGLFEKLQQRMRRPSLPLMSTVAEDRPSGSLLGGRLRSYSRGELWRTRGGSAIELGRCSPEPRKDEAGCNPS